MKAHWLTALAFLCLLAAALEFGVLRYDVAWIQSGEPYLYWLTVDRTARAGLALILVAGVGAWLLLRGMIRPLALLRPIAVIMLTGACCLFSVVMPLFSVSAGAHHIESIVSGEHQWHLYYQLQGIGVSECQHVLVRCDVSGWLCRYVDRWQVGSLCMGAFAPIQMRVLDAGIEVQVNGERLQYR
jgi:hypothetical protein